MPIPTACFCVGLVPFNFILLASCCCEQNGWSDTYTRSYAFKEYTSTYNEVNMCDATRFESLRTIQFFSALNMVAACTTETVYKTKSLQSAERSDLSSCRSDSLKSDDVTTKCKTFSFGIGYIKRPNKCTLDLRIQFSNTAVTNMFRSSCGHLQGGENKNRNIVSVCPN